MSEQNMKHTVQKYIYDQIEEWSYEFDEPNIHFIDKWEQYIDNHLDKLNEDTVCKMYFMCTGNIDTKLDDIELICYGLLFQNGHCCCGTNCEMYLKAAIDKGNKLAKYLLKNSGKTKLPNNELKVVSIDKMRKYIVKLLKDNGFSIDGVNELTDIVIRRIYYFWDGIDPNLSGFELLFYALIDREHRSCCSSSDHNHIEVIAKKGQGKYNIEAMKYMKKHYKLYEDENYYEYCKLLADCGDQESVKELSRYYSDKKKLSNLMKNCTDQNGELSDELKNHIDRGKMKIYFYILSVLLIGILSYFYLWIN